MNYNVFSDMVSYYASLAEQLTGEAKQAGILKNPSAIGIDKEGIYQRFLKRHMPYACEVFRGGYLFDIEGNRSKQIDLIVTSGMVPRFEMSEGNQAIAPIEGTIAVCEVKSTLDRERLYEALENFAEIPNINNPEEAVSPAIDIVSGTWSWEWPYRVIFAFNSINAHTLLQHVVTFYNDNPGIPYGRRPNMIHTLGSSVMLLLPEDEDQETLEIDRSESMFRPTEARYSVLDQKADICAMSILFNRLQRNAFISYHMIWKYGEWLNKIADEIRRESC